MGCETFSVVGSVYCGLIDHVPNHCSLKYCPWCVIKNRVDKDYAGLLENMVLKDIFKLFSAKILF